MSEIFDVSAGCISLHRMEDIKYQKVKKWTLDKVHKKGTSHNEINFGITYHHNQNLSKCSYKALNNLHGLMSLKLT